MFEIVLDTETTGLHAGKGDKICEIGCVLLENHMPAGSAYHVFVNPEREMPPEAEAVHGLSREFLKDKPTFRNVADELLSFIGDFPIIAHNASFDIGFLNCELGLINKPLIDSLRVIDTVLLAKKRFPGAQISLDALCRRFNIDLSDRSKHGALIDAELLSRVYLELIGGREPGLEFGDNNKGDFKGCNEEKKLIRKPRLYSASDEELSAHNKFMEHLQKQSVTI